MTEHEVQNYLYRHFFSGRRYGIPNIYLYQWESDFLSVTMAGRIHEYEIKVTRADFAADARKAQKHQILKSGCRELSAYEQQCIDDHETRGWNVPSFIANKMTDDKKIPERRPNYFWYVCPESVADVVPEYAGLIHCKPYLKVVKAAPLLHKEKITADMEKKILSVFYYRYWKIRNEAAA